MAKGTKVLNKGLQVDGRGNVYLQIRVLGEGSPDDGELGGSDMAFFVDVSGADPVLRVKMQGDGVVLSGDVATLTGP
tara:strand:- start:1163 stop:1393 length:231 start_codon:yes stop_codon:yes gene_type:complete